MFELIISSFIGYKQSVTASYDTNSCPKGQNEIHLARSKDLQKRYSSFAAESSIDQEANEELEAVSSEFCGYCNIKDQTEKKRIKRDDHNSQQPV
jgi:hypothetical protein